MRDHTRAGSILIALLACSPVLADGLAPTTGVVNPDPFQFYDFAFALGDSTINWTGGGLGAVTGTVFGTDGTYSVVGASAAVFDHATFNLISGPVPSMQSHGNGTFNLIGGTANGFAQSFDTSTFNVMGGEAADFQAHHQSALNMSGGYAHSRVISRDSSTIHLSGGTVESFLQSFDQSVMYFSGGSVLEADVQSHDQSQLFMSGGSVKRFGWAADQSTFTLSGGTLGWGFLAFDQANVVIEAYDFSYAGGDIDFGGGTELVLTAADDLFSDLIEPFGKGDSWRAIPSLTVHYSDGTIDSFTYYGHVDGWQTAGEWTGTLTLRLIPAPGAVPLLALAVLCRGTRRRR